MRQELLQLRHAMKQQDIQVYVIPSGDDHHSEYVHPHYQGREYISGFTGSAGTLIVTTTNAYLWTDGRYFVQAERQLENSGITLRKSGVPGVETPPEFLEDLAKKQAYTIGFHGKTVSLAAGKVIKEKLEPFGCRLQTQQDLVGEIWKERPAITASSIYPLPVEATGMAVIEKIQAVRNVMKDKGAEQLLVTDLAEIAWLFNCRGSDIACTPVFFAFALVCQEDVNLYVMAPEKQKDLPIEQLEKICCKIKDYDEIYKDIRQITGTLWIDPATTNYGLYQLVPEAVLLQEKPMPISGMKAIKNSVEIRNTLEAHKRDGLCMTRFLYWIKQRIQQEKPLTEMMAAAWLDGERKERGGATDLSFPTIAGYGSHGAVVHYQVTKDTDARLKPEGFFLVDSGGQYEDGTTDITRTIAMGPLSQKMKAYYTYVLKSHIALSSAVFPPGTDGRKLDYLAREPLRQQGLDYSHGTGHGVGHMLGVHENPPVISLRNAETPLEPGMITSCEPGVYIEGEFGIRLENELLCKEIASEEKRYGFSPITFCPFERDAILPELLTNEERQWINDYHHKVAEVLTPHLEPEIGKWLEKETMPL